MNRAREEMANDPDLPGETEEPAAAAPNGELAASAEDVFKTGARLLFGSDWQREAARALGRDENALARFLLGDRTVEDGEQLYAEMLDLMRRRAGEINAMADRFADTIAAEREKAAAEKAASDQGM
jgi:hypothetical protein